MYNRYPEETKRNVVAAIRAGITPVVIIPDDSNPPVCSACGVQMVKVGETYTDSIARTELFTIVRRVRNIYACVNCSEGARQTVHSDNILENTVAAYYTRITQTGPKLMVIYGDL